MRSPPRHRQMTIPAEKPDRPPELIVGLGNPGARHRFSRHNAGFSFVDRLMIHARFKSMGLRPDLDAFGVLVFIQKIKVLLIKPLNYMNRSGDVVRRVLAFGERPANRMLVVHDDLDLPPGAARLKFGGGHGGHKGLSDVIKHCGADFLRLRLGVGRPGAEGDAGDVARYVLSPPEPSEVIALERAMRASLKALATLYARGLQAAMNELHAPAVH